MIRVAQCYTGGVGSEIIRRLAGHPHMELVGVLVHSDDKAGRDSGELVGAAANGIVSTQKLDDIIALHPDAAIWSGLLFDTESMARLLAAGINVYTGIGAYWLPGELEHDALAEARDDARQPGLDGVRRDVTRRDPGATREDHRLAAVARECRRECSGDRVRLVGHDDPLGDGVPARREQLRHQPAAGIGVERACITHRHHHGRHRRDGALAMVVMGVLRRRITHAWSSTQYSPSVATSFFQIGTSTFRVSIA